MTNKIKYHKVMPLTSDSDETTFVELYDIEENNRIVYCVRIIDLNGCDGVLPIMKFKETDYDLAVAYFTKCLKN